MSRRSGAMPALLGQRKKNMEKILFIKHFFQ
jgi:hypothetical protein